MSARDAILARLRAAPAGTPVAPPDDCFEIPAERRFPIMDDFELRTVTEWDGRGRLHPFWIRLARPIGADPDLLPRRRRRGAVPLDHRRHRAAHPARRPVRGDREHTRRLRGLRDQHRRASILVEHLPTLSRSIAAGRFHGHLPALCG